MTNGGTTAPLAGGTTTLHLDWNGRWKHAEPSLGGTIVNCAGGPTPWGSWLTCEETNIDLTPLGGLRHGYVFEVRRHAAATTGVPLTDMGRFPHEAVAVDPRNHTVYLTEDSRNQSGFYRFIRMPAAAARAISRMAAVCRWRGAEGIANADLLTAQVGDTYQIEWADIADPDAVPGPFTAPHGGGGASGPFLQGWAQGALRISRGEGIWHQRQFYIVDTSTGVDSQSRPGAARARCGNTIRTTPAQATSFPRTWSTPTTRQHHGESARRHSHLRGWRRRRDPSASATGWWASRGRRLYIFAKNTSCSAAAQIAAAARWSARATIEATNSLAPASIPPGAFYS